MNDVGFQDCLTLTEEGCTKTFEVGEVGSREGLEGVRVANGDEVLSADLWNDRNVGGKVEMYGQRDEFIQRK
jgi:hypothetical protein